MVHQVQFALLIVVLGYINNNPKTPQDSAAEQDIGIQAPGTKPNCHIFPQCAPA
jgi:hypothetical protein